MHQYKIHQSISALPGGIKAAYNENTEIGDQVLSQAADRLNRVCKPLAGFPAQIQSKLNMKFNHKHVILACRLYNIYLIYIYIMLKTYENLLVPTVSSDHMKYLHA